MCLEISENWEKETETFRNSSKILIGYKILEKVDDEFYSIFYKTEHKIGEISISNRKSKDLDSEELAKLKVYQGIHFYQNIKDIPKCKFNNNPCLYPYRCLYPYQYQHRYPCPYHCLRRWAKFEIDPTDLVAIGKFDDSINFIALKAKFIEILE